MKSLFGGVVLTFEDLGASELVCFKMYRSINAFQVRPLTIKKCDHCLSRQINDSVQRTTGWRKLVSCWLIRQLACFSLGEESAMFENFTGCFLLHTSGYRKLTAALIDVVIHTDIAMA